MENLLNAVVCSPKFDENENNEPYFSWQSCENCNSHLGDNRYDVEYRETLDGDNLEASICEDCFMELCS